MTSLIAVFTLSLPLLAVSATATSAGAPGPPHDRKTEACGALSNPTTLDEQAIAREALSDYPDSDEITFEDALSDRVSDSKVWVTAFVPHSTSSNEYVFYRVAVDLARKSAVSVQRFIMSTPGNDGISTASMFVDGSLFWKGTVDALGETTTSYQATSSDAHLQGVCEWIMAGVCGTGGGVGCYGVCVGLAFTTGWGGIACAGACGLVASLGCAGATMIVCG